MNIKKLWRPALFSALGAGFKDDGTVRDGIHLRWNFEPRLGLPFELRRKRKGNFKVFYMNQSVKSIKNIDLFEADRNLYQINFGDLFNLNDNPSGLGGKLLPANNRIYFTKESTPDHVAVDWHIKNSLKYIKALSSMHTAKEKKIIPYIEKVMDGYRPNFVPLNSSQEISEICAVDIDFLRNPLEGSSHFATHGRSGNVPKFTLRQFEKMNATYTAALTGNLSKFANISNHKIIKDTITNSRIKNFNRTPILRRNVLATHAISTLRNPSLSTTARLRNPIRISPTISLSRFSNDIYVKVKAWDKNDQLIAQDWIGKYGRQFFLAGVGGNAINNSGKLKTRIKLRAPGIAYITFEFIPNKPKLFPKYFNYVFCEDYCRSEKIWSSSPVYETRFNGVSAYHSPATVRDKHYFPFHKNFNWGQLSQEMRKHFIENNDIQELLKQQSSYATYHYNIHYDAQDATPENFDSIDFPLLSTLLSASIDPSFANILGLYKYIEDLELDGVDFKVEADFPFFEEQNIDKIDVKLTSLLSNNINMGLLQQAKLVFKDTKLCGLILAPRITKKSLPPRPKPLDYTIKTIDLPNQQDPKRVDLFGDAKITIPINENEILPYRRIVAVALDRSKNGSAFENIIEEEDTTFDPLDGFSLLPSVYLPKKEDGILKNPLKINDYFSFPAIATNHIQYQGTGYDIFGRPSNAAVGPVREIVAPCKEPHSPSNLSGQIISKGDALFYEVHFSLHMGKLPLVAKKELVEFTIHEFPESTNPPLKVTWAGHKTAKVFTINFNPTKTKLALNSLATTCRNLSWAGGTLQHSGANAALCNALFSNELPVITKVPDPAAIPAIPDLKEYKLVTYKLLWKITTKSALAPAMHRWACRIRVKGICDVSGTIKHSKEAIVTGNIRITPPPPPVQQPILTTIPESTYADYKGDAYFSVDLNDFIAVGNRASKPMVRLYMTTIDKLFDDVTTIVSKNTLLNQVTFLKRAKKEKLPYKLITTNPIRYTASNRFVEVKVPGNLKAYYAIGVIGCNEYLEEVSWKQAGSLIFKTPAPLAIPQLQHIFTDPFIGLGIPKIALQFSAKFSDVLPVAGQLPRIQILRKNNTVLEQQFLYLDTVEGVISDASTATEAIYIFDFIDENVITINRYEYEIFLLIYSVKHGHYIKSTIPIRCKAKAPLEEGIDPTQKIDLPSVISSPTALTISFEFDSGEYDFSLTKRIDGGTKNRYTGKIRNGVLYSKEIDAKLLITNRYKLIFQDNNIENGVYTLRLSYGQGFTWTKKIAVTL